MKSVFCGTALLALAVAVTATTGTISQAQGQSTPPAAAEAGAPADIVPGSPLSDVIKMLQAGVDAATVKSYILTSQSPFNLDADKIVYLRDMGASPDLINAMMDRDRALSGGGAMPAPAPVPDSAPVAAPVAPDTSMSPPPADISVDYFNNTLTPYGAWVQVDGYGRCWRPTVAFYNVAWSPYCDSGRWIYSDYGWYWDSDYSWGATFHYGRWFRSPRFGWCWYPDTVWAPSWVAWRSGGDYCGWAPLPPFAVFVPGAGFFYRGAATGVDFDFGLAADCFVFVSPAHFCDRQPRSFCVPRERLTEVFHRTTIVNNYSVNNRTLVNRGFGPERIAAAAHRPIEPVPVSSIANAGRQGFRGPGFEQTLRPVPVARPTGLNGNAVRPAAGNYRFPAPAAPSAAANRGESQISVHQPQLPQQQPQTRSALTESSRVMAPDQIQNRAAVTAGGEAGQQRAGSQFEQRQVNVPEQPHPGNGQVLERNANQPGQGNAQGAAPAQTRNSGNSGNNGANNANNNQNQKKPNP
ncbi:MAG: DUF6600 domain-containing protein [Verrucomicrobiota bacterium]|jgi:hypothetical protein